MKKVKSRPVTDPRMRNGYEYRLNGFRTFPVNISEQRFASNTSLSHCHKKKKKRKKRIVVLFDLFDLEMMHRWWFVCKFQFVHSCMFRPCHGVVPLTNHHPAAYTSNFLDRLTYGTCSKSYCRHCHSTVLRGFGQTWRCHSTWAACYTRPPISMGWWWA